MKWIFFTLSLASLVFYLMGCSSTPSTVSASTQAREKLEEKWNGRIGKATKADLIEEFGQPQWCKQEESGTGEETCRFFRKHSTKWMGEKKERTHYSTYDEMIVEFDSKGRMKTYRPDVQR